MSKRVSIPDFLTKDEIKLARELKVAREIYSKITKPNIKRINKAIGQENDPMYLAYMIEYVISLSKD